jgi:hypothetical protein
MVFSFEHHSGPFSSAVCHLIPSSEWLAMPSHWHRIRRYVLHVHLHLTQASLSLQHTDQQFSTLPSTHLSYIFIPPTTCHFSGLPSFYVGLPCLDAITTHMIFFLLETVTSN